MANTPNLRLPYPVEGDLPAGHTQIEALARAVDDAVTDADTWRTWTATITGATVSAQRCRYMRTPGGLVHVEIVLTIATLTGSMSVSAPFSRAAGTPLTDLLCALVPTSGQAFPGSAQAGTAAFFPFAVDPATNRRVTLAPTVPFTWSSGAQLRISGTYSDA